MSHPLRVLVVDDNPDGADSAAMLLDLAGHETRVAYSGGAALADAVAFAPDVVLLDIGLRDGYGVEVGARMLATLPDRPVLVALTGYPHLEDECRQAGFDLYFVKPLAPERLLGLMDEVGSQLEAA